VDPVGIDAEKLGVRFGARAALAAGALALLAVPFGLVLFLVQDKWPPLLQADDAGRDQLHALDILHPALVTVMAIFSTIGSWWVYLAGFLVVVTWLLHRGLRRLALFVVVTVGGSPLLNEVVKLAVHRARPILPNPVAHASGASFPSGHAQGAVVGYAVLLLVFLPVLRGATRRLLVAAAVMMVLAIGFSRVALGVHYLSDVLAGYLLGAAWVTATTVSFNTWRRERGLRAVRPPQGLEPEQATRLDPASSGTTPPVPDR
jgi:membrane-associated phospholipid phosphatase